VRNDLSVNLVKASILELDSSRRADINAIA